MLHRRIANLAALCVFSTIVVAFALPLTAPEIAWPIKMRAVFVAFVSFVVLAGLTLRAAPALKAMMAHGGSSALDWRWTTSIFLAQVAVFTIMLLAFWPGVMTEDSFNQWDGVLKNEIWETYTVTHSLLVWAVAKLGLTPTGVIVFQYILLAASATYALREASRWGVPRSVLLMAAFAFAAFPGTAFLSVTLWKDLPYSAGMILCFGAVLGFIRGRGDAADRRSLGPFIAGLMLVLLTRLNGLISATPLPILLTFAQPRGRRAIMLSLSGLCLVVFFGLKFVISPLAGFGSIGPQYAAIVPIHIIGAMVKDGQPLDRDDEALIESILPRDAWLERYHCQNVGALFFTSPAAQQTMAARKVDLALLAGRLALEHPGSFLKHQLCVTSLVWQVMPWDEAWLTIVPEQSERGLGVPEHLRTSPILQKANDAWRAIRTWTASYDWTWLFWRPAGYLYALLFLVGSMCITTGRWIPLTLAALPVLNTLSLLPTIGSPDYRYQYGVVATALLFLPLLFARRQPVKHLNTNG